MQTYRKSSKNAVVGGQWREAGVPVSLVARPDD
jgi:hypothetical protein